MGEPQPPPHWTWAEHRAGRRGCHRAIARERERSDLDGPAAGATIIQVRWGEGAPSSRSRQPLCSFLSYLVNPSTKPDPPPTSITYERRQSRTNAPRSQTTCTQKGVKRQRARQNTSSLCCRWCAEATHDKVAYAKRESSPPLREPAIGDWRDSGAPEGGGRGDWVCPEAAVRAVPARLLLLCLLLRSSWLTAGGRPSRRRRRSAASPGRADGQPWPCRSAWRLAFQTSSVRPPIPLRGTAGSKPRAVASEGRLTQSRRPHKPAPRCASEDAADGGAADEQPGQRERASHGCTGHAERFEQLALRAGVARSRGR